MKEHYYEKLLNIKTMGEQKEFSDFMHYHPYESTPYDGLEVLFDQYEVKRSDRSVDFGCGKGRVNIHYFYQATVVGIEVNPYYYQEAIKNRYRYLEKYSKSMDTIFFHNCKAESYQINAEDNRFYFFNPFSVQIFIKIIHNILQSFEKFPRAIEVILYYSSEDYMYFLEYQMAFELKQEIIVPQLYKDNPYEKFLIYQLTD